MMWLTIMTFLFCFPSIFFLLLLLTTRCSIISTFTRNVRWLIERVKNNNNDNRHNFLSDIILLRHYRWCFDEIFSEGDDAHQYLPYSTNKIKFINKSLQLSDEYSELAVSSHCSLTFFSRATFKQNLWSLKNNKWLLIILGITWNDRHFSSDTW